MEGGQRNHVFDGGAHWRHLLNPVGWSIRGSDAALYQMTLTTCCCRVVTLWGIRWRCVLAANSQLLCQSFLSMFRSFTSVHRVYCGHVALGECKCSRVALWLSVFLTLPTFFQFLLRNMCFTICFRSKLIFVSFFCLWTPGNRLMIVFLWCALSLSVWSAVASDWNIPLQQKLGSPPYRCTCPT